MKYIMSVGHYLKEIEKVIRRKFKLIRNIYNYNS